MVANNAHAVSRVIHIRPSGSTPTAPYNTGATAANSLSIAYTYLASTGQNPNTAPYYHAIFIEAGNYANDYLYVSGAFLVNAKICVVDSMTDGTAYTAADYPSVCSNTARATITSVASGKYGIWITSTSSGVELSGAYVENPPTVGIFVEGTNFIGNRVGVKNGAVNLFRATGSGSYSISKGEFLGSSYGTPISHESSGNGEFIATRFDESETNMLGVDGGATKCISNSGAGNLSIYDSFVSGCILDTITNSGAGSTIIRNSILYGGSRQSTNYVFKHTAGTIDYDYNFIIPPLWYSTQISSGSVTDGGHNTIVGANNLGITRRARHGIIIPGMVDLSATLLSYVQGVENLLAAKGWKGVTFSGHDAVADIPTDMAAMATRGTLQIGSNGYGHNKLTSTASIMTIAGCGTIDIQRQDEPGHGHASDAIATSTGPTITDFKTKTLTEISTELTAGGCAVGAVNQDYSYYAPAATPTLGEIIADSNGAQASGYGLVPLKDTTATRGWYYEEMVLSKNETEALTGESMTLFGFPGNSTDANALTAAHNAGMLIGRTATVAESSADWHVYQATGFDILKLGRVVNYSDLIGDGTEAGTKAATRRVLEYASQRGGIFYFLGYTADNISLDQWSWILDTIAEYTATGDITVTDADGARTLIAQDWTAQSSNASCTGTDTPYIGCIGSGTGTLDQANRYWLKNTFTSPVNYMPVSTSPLIDAGTSTSLTTDLVGNPIYGLPDIGAYEYQPPHTIGDNGIDIGAGARIYGDGQFRDVGTTSSTTADLTITPSSGTFTEDTSPIPAWLDVSAITWSNTGTHHKQWTESNNEEGLTDTLHTVGDLDNNTYYTVSVTDATNDDLEGDNCDIIGDDFVCQSNSEGEIEFTYTGTYSDHTFTVEEGDNTPPYRSLGLPSGEQASGTSQITISLTTDESATCKYSATADTAYASMTGSFTNVGGTAHSTASITGLTDGTFYTYYVRCIDATGNANADDYEITFSVAEETATEDEDTDTDHKNLEITNISSSSASNSITIEWETNNKSDSKVFYGTSKDLGNEKKETTNVKEHKVTIDKLDPDTIYYFKVKSIDREDDEDTSDIHSIKTEKEEESGSSIETQDFASLPSGENGSENNDSNNSANPTEAIKDKVEEVKEQKKQIDNFFTAQINKIKNKFILSEIKLRIIDKNNNPIPNLLATIHSEPQTSTTNQEGIITFKDIEAGKHTIKFAYQNETYEKRIAIEEPKDGINTIQAQITDIKAEHEKLPMWVFGTFAFLILVIIWLAVKARRRKNIV